MEFQDVVADNVFSIIIVIESLFHQCCIILLEAFTIVFIVLHHIELHHYEVVHLISDAVVTLYQFTIN